MSHVENKINRAGALPKKIWSRILLRWLSRITNGELTVRLPDGAMHHVQGERAGPSATLNIHSGAVVWKLVSGGDLGFARSYIDGDWDTPDLSKLLELGQANEAALNAVLDAPGIAKALAYLRHLGRANTLAGSRRNIAFHYDLGNEFYSHWLDETMTYSSAIFSSNAQTLADAQRAKYERIICKLNICADDHVLEIGCGWGGFAEYAAKRTGCRITGLTLSREQAQFSRDRLAAKGLSGQVEIRLQDYRNCTGKFDSIVSIEMFEAVGERNWPTYFNALKTLLKPGGSALLQVITIANSYFEQYRRNADFIQTYIFPGGMLPSFAAFSSAASQEGLTMQDCSFFGADYAKTLLQWDQAFNAAWHKIEALGFDARFRRMWHYYLHYCAIGFRTNRIDVGQFHLTTDHYHPPGNDHVR